MLGCRTHGLQRVALLINGLLLQVAARAASLGACCPACCAQPMLTCARRPLLLLKRLSHWVPLQTATLLYEMQRRGKGARFGVVSMCIGSGGWAHGSAGLGRLAKPAGARTTHVVCAKAACAGWGKGSCCVGGHPKRQVQCISRVPCWHTRVSLATSAYSRPVLQAWALQQCLSAVARWTHPLAAP